MPMTIIIRKAKPGDGKAIITFFSSSCNNDCNECMNRYVCNKRFFNGNFELIDKKLKGKGTCMLLALDDDKIVGLSMYSISKFDKARHRAEVGWLMSKSYLRRGIATQLVEALIKEAHKNNITRLEAESSVNNDASLKLAKKFGFEIEGRKKKALRFGNKYEDTYILGKLL